MGRQGVHLQVELLVVAGDPGVADPRTGRGLGRRLLFGAAGRICRTRFRDTFDF